MARREVEVEEIGNLYRFTKLGQSLDGIFEGTHEADGQFGRQTFFDIKGDDDVVYSVPGSAGLSPKMAKVAIGSRVWITYIDDRDVGKNRDGTDKNPMKVFKVEIDDGQQQLAATGTVGKKPPF